MTIQSSNIDLGNDKKYLYSRLNKYISRICNLKQKNEIYKELSFFISNDIDVDFLIVSRYEKITDLLYTDFVFEKGEICNVTNLPPISVNAVGQGLLNMVIRNCEPLLINNYQESIRAFSTDHIVSSGKIVQKEYIETKDEELTNSAILVPLFTGKEIFGVLQVQSYKSDAYQIGDLDLLYLLSRITCFEIQNREVGDFQKIQKHELENKISERTQELTKQVNELKKMNKTVVELTESQQVSYRLLKSASKALKERNKDLESFSHSISHDLRTPLRHIGSFTDLLYKKENGHLDQTSLRYIENIMKSVKKMENLVEGLLHFFQTGEMEFHKQVVNINNIVGKIISEIELLNKNQIIWKISEFPEVIANWASIHQVFENLISNAVKFSSKNPTPKIEIGFKTMDLNKLASTELEFNNETKRILIYIQDNGVGFDNRYKSRLFALFQRLHSNDDFEGIGLGLPLVKRILSKHNQLIWAESELGKGATFFFTLDTISPGIKNDQEN